MELSIDTAGDRSGVALSLEGRVVAEFSWHAGHRHASELMPAVDDLLRRAGLTKRDLSAVFVNIGPGSYVGLRVGVSTAKGLAYGLGVPLVGVGRLELDAYPYLGYPARLVPVHRAGRGEVAWAVYLTAGGVTVEQLPPRMTRPETMLGAVEDPALFCGELDGEIRSALEAAGRWIAPHLNTERRPACLAELGWKRLREGRTHDPKTLAPLYLREPAIGPQSA
ncbi:MAG TPA: tRNA (adenosine(37)-N6)-threonylcarbamoyltransferase complex dimerization subunit type 1 TsaB [Dehalococcoidia bacterium]|jgi:tRNA threonylcarbamoyladenosine biosynthesis protein TsaB|nr:tRNA (adenosine(37)-N6)-threonylcarbamoyltransferase complex dimerization subunit type 1 TsaB [Dehalococcoidia bacterium]